MKISVADNKLALVLINSIGFLVLFGVGYFLPKGGEATAVSGWLLLIGFIAITLIHEVLHALFLKFFSPSARVYFGFKSLCPYAMSRGGHYTKVQFLWTLLAPFTIINSVLVLLTVLSVLPPVYAACFLVVHTYMCSGDFFMAWLTRQVSADDLITDHPEIVGFMVVDA